MQKRVGKNRGIMQQSGVGRPSRYIHISTRPTLPFLKRTLPESIFLSNTENVPDSRTPLNATLLAHSHIHQKKVNNTPSRPSPMPLTSFAGLAAPPFVAVAVAAAVDAAVPAVMLLLSALSKV